MSVDNLTSVNVDSLFEQLSAAEIDTVQKKIQTEIEQKREELRTMVGERYRDLLTAADTIGCMRNSSGELCSQVEKVMTSCRSLNEKQLIGFQSEMDAVKIRSMNKQLNLYFSTVVQIKLLSRVPEMIWYHIDNERFYLATELFALSRHISTGLQLDVNNPLMKHFPVAKRQWENLRPFHSTIKQSVLVTLEREELSSEMASDGLLCLLLLEKNSLNGILKTFVQLRSMAFLASITSQDEQRRVKQRILGSLKVFNSTIQLIHKCLFASDDSDGLIFKKLRELKNRPPSISLIEGHQANYTYLLPDIITNFRPKLENPVIKPDELKATIEGWLADISKLAGIHLKPLFGFVSSMKVIQEIRRDSALLRQQDSWGYICERFGINRDQDFYESVYKPLVYQRIREVIKECWSTYIQEILNKVESILSSKKEFVNQLWVDSAMDLPLSLKDALSEDKKIKSLLMKSRGFDKDIIAICFELDERLGGIVSEIKILLEEVDTTTEEKTSLAEYLRETSEQQVQELITNIKNVSLGRELQQLLFVVRLLSAFIDLCPKLKTCLSQSYYNIRSWTVPDITQKKTPDNWARVYNMLEDESFQMWKLICTKILDKNPIDEFMSNPVCDQTILGDFVKWEVVSIEQKDEQDNTIESTFRIPCQPRISLQQYLFSVVVTLNRLVPQILPHKVLMVFVSQLIQRLLEYYKAQAENKFTANSQNCALQLYFDVKFLQTVFVFRDDRVILEQYQLILAALKELIDPFDFELFSKHISLNVKKSVSRMHCQFGVIIPHPLLNIPSLTQIEKEPNVLNLSSNGSSIRFPLLPIITTRGHNSDNSTTYSISAEVEKNAMTKNTQKGTASRSQKSGAAAFFGAMSQEWFR